MSHELKDCYVTGQYEGHSCVFVIKVEATEDLSLVNADNFEDFLESHNYKVVKCQTDVAASYLASQLMVGSLIVDYAGSDSDSIYVMLRDPAIYIENGSLGSLSKAYTEKWAAQQAGKLEDWSPVDLPKNSLANAIANVDTSPVDIGEWDVSKSSARDLQIAPLWSEELVSTGDIANLATHAAIEHIKTKIESDKSVQDSVYKDLVSADPLDKLSPEKRKEILDSLAEKLGIDSNVVAECEETGDTKVKVQDLSSPHSVSGVAYNPMKGINFK